APGPRTRAARCRGARPALPAAVPARLPRPVRRMRPPEGRARTGPPPRAARPPLGGPDRVARGRADPGRGGGPLSRRRGRNGVADQPARTDVETLTEALGTSIDSELLVLALTHRSFAHEAGGIPTNERLEFLGDSVLGIIVTEHLYRTHPAEAEGDLARMRAATVSQKALASVARTIGLGEYILLG